MSNLWNVSKSKFEIIIDSCCAITFPGKGEGTYVEGKKNYKKEVLMMSQRPLEGKKEIRFASPSLQFRVFSHQSLCVFVPFDGLQLRSQHTFSSTSISKRPSSCLWCGWGSGGAIDSTTPPHPCIHFRTALAFLLRSRSSS